MRVAAVRLSRAASRAVAVRPDAATPSVASENGAAVKARPMGAALERRAEALAGRADAVASKVFAGACARASYAPDTPILSQALNPSPPASAPSRPAPQRCEGPVPMPRPPEVKRSLVELEQMSAAELKNMLTLRGVGAGNATEKAELARWVHQHQDLPILSREKQHDIAVQNAKRSSSLADFKKMPVKELRKFLQERGVSEGSTTEKSELVQWVWQHRDLPVLRKDDPRRENAGRWRRGIRPGPGGPSYDLPRDEPEPEEPKLDQIEGKEQEQLEGGDTKLLEGGTSGEAAPSPWR